MPRSSRRSSGRTISRRTVLRHSLVAAAAAPCVPAAAFPGGVFVAGSDRIRIGLIGCGGRGTGAARLAAEIDRDVTITALGDLFSDQVALAADVLSAAVPAAFDCPADRRFHGPAAASLVASSDVDAVILAAPPATRPAHLATVIAAGRHVYCETPAAVDETGLAAARAAFRAARDRGLAVVSGLAWRHDPTLIAVMDRIRAGEFGTPRTVRVVSEIGLPWVAGRTAGGPEARNWIRSEQLSGGSFVEHHIHAIDKALWALGDDLPETVTALPAGGGIPGMVRYRFADGRSFDAALFRRAGGADRIEELVRAARGSIDLRRATDGAAGGRYRDVMRSLVSAIRTGRRTEDAEQLVRATDAALRGRRAIATGPDAA